MKKAPFTSFYILLFVSTACLAQIQLNPSPTRVVGQDTLTQSTVNLVEGREFSSPQGVALDLSQNPPILYVADTGNNRVLGFRNAQAPGNGQKADIVIGQVDFLSTNPQGPPRQGGGQFRSTGLTAPIGLAVDATGNLYVVDAGNNRILRFPKPFSQSNQAPDLVIGQSGFTGFVPNPNGVSAATLALTTANGILQAYIALDPRTGDLYAADPGNNRVLRYPAALLGPNSRNGPAADLVLGQLDFATTTRNADPNSVNGVAAPTGVAFDQSGHLFVSESQAGVRSRVLVYTNPSRSGQPATRIVGVVPSSVTPQPLPVSEQQFAGSVSGLFTINNGLGVTDTLNNRLLVFRPVDAFSSDVLTQRAQLVIGQPDFSSAAPNQAAAEAGADRLNGPTAAAASGTELYVADANNNRVLVFPYSGSAAGSATRVFGQDQFNQYAPNLVEGREFHFQAGANSGEAGIVADLTSNPPHLYVSDTFNNRVLGFRDLRTIKPGDRADIVIGQPDFSRTVPNYPSGDFNVPTASSLFLPTGLILDPAGNLYVADSGNGRVLRFSNPFTQPQALPAANLVLGQRSATASRNPDASAVTMAFPYGLAFASNNGLLVSDRDLNRVLFFRGAPGELTSGMAASIVFGQPDFNTPFPSNSAGNRFSQPRGIATDSDDRLYVADAGNNRVVVFERAPSQPNDPRESATIGGFSSPRSVFITPMSGEIFVANQGGNNILRFPRFNNLPLTGNTPTLVLPDFGPLAVTQDPYGNVYTADSNNRVQINFPALNTVNAASMIANQSVAPGTIATIYGFTNQFGAVTAIGAGSPLPTQLAGIQVLFNNTPVPLYYVGPNQINFVVPNGAPTSGSADLLVTRVDTGQILGNYPVPLNVASPALFTFGTGGSGQVAAINEDGTINGKDHPATNGSIVAFFGTGPGAVPNAPPDGVAPTTALPTATNPQVIIGASFVADQNITYSGLAPGLVGVWQVNVKIPDDVAPTSLTPNMITPVVFVVNGIASNGPTRLVTSIWLTPKK